MKAKQLILISFLISTELCCGQQLSQKQLSISFQNASALEALNRINAMPDIKLAYNPDIIPSSNVISKTYDQAPLSIILSDILGKKYEYLSRGSYIIIQKIGSNDQRKSNYKIASEVKDSKTGIGLEDVTVYEINSLNSTLTNSQGSFELLASARSEGITFAISRVDYQDTIVQVKEISTLPKSLLLDRVEESGKIRKNRFEIETKKLVQFFTSKNSRKNSRNVKLEKENPIQISLVPSLGSNGKLSGQITNRFSLNVIAGYAYGLKGVEIAGFYNINRMKMNGVQIGGFGNASGGETKGVQVAGFINTTKGYTSGVQTAGFLNVVTDDVKGLQLAGFLNIAKKTKGAQIGGFTNISSENFKGLQLSGFSNTTEDLRGAQISGFVNTAQDVEGVQVAGFINRAKVLRGIQLSVLNVVDSVKNGATIGILNLVKTGKHEFAIEHNDFMDYSAAFRSGTDQFYSLLSAGIRTSTNNLWSYGLGFGSQFKLTEKFYGNIEISANTINNTSRTDDKLNLLNRLNLNLGYKLANRFALNGGPVLNVYVTEVFDPFEATYGDDFGQAPFYNTTNSGVNLSMWMGYAFSLRF